MLQRRHVGSLKRQSIKELEPIVLKHISVCSPMVNKNNNSSNYESCCSTIFYVPDQEKSKFLSSLFRNGNAFCRRSCSGHACSSSFSIAGRERCRRRPRSRSTCEEPEIMYSHQVSYYGNWLCSTTMGITITNLFVETLCSNGPIFLLSPSYKCTIEYFLDGNIYLDTVLK